VAALRVLVTGVAGGVGQAIIKALKASKLDLEIVGADISPNAAGFHWTDAAVLLPRLEIDGKYDEIAELLRSENIDLVLIGSEHDLLFFSRHRMDLERDTGAVIVVSGPEIIDLADDKWKTVGHLKRLGLPHALSSVPRSREEALGDAKEFGYPLVLKSRTGSSARNVHLI
jgi:carbamoyl-phosphate synthase large subunit